MNWGRADRHFHTLSLVEMQNIAPGKSTPRTKTLLRVLTVVFQTTLPAGWLYLARPGVKHEPERASVRFRANLCPTGR